MGFGVGALHGGVQVTALARFLPGFGGNLHRLPAATDERLVADVIASEREPRCGVGVTIDAVMAVGAITRHRGTSPWNDRLCVAPEGPPRRLCLHEHEWICPLCLEGDDECRCGGGR